jgi:3-hydroxybutyryl-CoA dehydrogenase
MSERVAVVGAGQMGNGIAHVFAQAGFLVLMIDVSPDALARARATIEKNLNRQVQKGTIDAAARDAALARIRDRGELDAVSEADLVVEAATENAELKFRIFRDLDRHAPAGAVLASNTSSISITEIAARTTRPERVIGMHFMNPVPVMQLVEIIRGAATSDQTYAATRALAERMGKTAVVSRDFPGFIVNRILIPMLNEACFVLMEGIASAEDIDTAMKLGTNQPMGPLQLADFIGLDTVLYIAEVMHRGLGDPKYRPAPLLRQYVEAGWLGKKAGRGFYSYSGGGAR